MAKKQKINQLKEQLKKKISEELKLGSIVYGKKLFKNKWITNKTKPFIFGKHLFRGSAERWVIYYLEDKNKEFFTKYGEFIPVPEFRFKYFENQEFRKLNKIHAKSLTLTALLELVKSEHIYPELTEDPIAVEPKEEPEIDFDKKLEDKEKKPVDKPKLNIDIVDYSAAAIALFGDTYKIKTELKTLGARWNNKLKVNGEIKAGWILPKSKKEKVNDIIKKYKPHLVEQLNIPIEEIPVVQRVEATDDTKYVVISSISEFDRLLRLMKINNYKYTDQFKNLRTKLKLKSRFTEPRNGYNLLWSYDYWWDFYCTNEGSLIYKENDKAYDNKPTYCYIKDEDGNGHEYKYKLVDKYTDLYKALLSTK